MGFACDVSVLVYEVMVCRCLFSFQPAVGEGGEGSGDRDLLTDLLEGSDQIFVNASVFIGRDVYHKVDIAFEIGVCLRDSPIGAFGGLDSIVVAMEPRVGQLIAGNTGACELARHLLSCRIFIKGNVRARKVVWPTDIHQKAIGLVSGLKQRGL